MTESEAFKVLMSAGVILAAVFGTVLAVVLYMLNWIFVERKREKKVEKPKVIYRTPRGPNKSKKEGQS